MVVGDKVVTKRDGWVGVIWGHSWDGTEDDKPWKVYVRKSDTEVDWHYFYTHELQVVGNCGEFVEGDYDHPLYLLMVATRVGDGFIKTRLNRYNSQFGQGLGGS